MSTTGIKYEDICDKCAHGAYCDMATFGGHNPKIVACCKFTNRHQTNGDRIRAMTDEELAAFIGHASLCVTIQGMVDDWCARYGSCTQCIRDWLKQEATDD